VNHSLARTTKHHPIEASILSHIKRYGVTTAVAACMASVRGMTSCEKSEERLEALVRKKELERCTLDGRTRCYRIASAPTNPASATMKQLSTQKRMRLFGCLAFCCLQEVNRHKVTANELKNTLPEIAQTTGSAVSHYVVETQEKKRFGFLRVDVGGHGRWDRVVATFAKDLRRHLNLLEIQNLAQVHAFEAALVTALPDKAERIKQQMEKYRTVFPIPIRVEAVPRLIDIYSIAPDHYR